MNSSGRHVNHKNTKLRLEMGQMSKLKLGGHQGANGQKPY